MHYQCHLSTYRHARNISAVVAAGLIGVRAGEILSLWGSHELLVATGTPLFVLATMTAAVASHQAQVRELKAAVQKAEGRASAAEEEVKALRNAVRSRVQEIMDQQAREDEERGWWEEGVGEDTVAFGQAVIRLDCHRPPRPRGGEKRALR